MKSLFINPFEKIQENSLLSIGVFAMLIGSFVGFTYNARFDGLLDLHFVQKTHFSIVILDNLINSTSAILILFSLAKYINSKTRLIDIITTILIGRIPFYILPFFNTNGYISSTANKILEVIQNPQITNTISFSTYAIITLFLITAIIFMIWSILLFYNGFKVACHLKTYTHSLIFTGGIFLSEIVTKVLIHLFNQSAL
jgi:hypothetical protein